MRHRGALMPDVTKTDYHHNFFRFGNGEKWHIQDDSSLASGIKPVCTFARDHNDVTERALWTNEPGGPICRQCLWGRERIHWDRAEQAARQARRDQ